MTGKRYSISELAKKAQVSVRTIRYYIDEGLLPPPTTTGRYATYGEDYLTRLNLIKELQNAFLPLKEIRKQISHLTIAEIEELLEQYQTKPEQNTPLAESSDDYQADPSTAIEYLSKVLEAHTEEYQKPERPRARLQRSNSEVTRDDQDTIVFRRFELGEGIELTIPENIYRRHRSLLDNWIINAKMNFSKWIKES
jgi:DNA-binding transcriptional MerR regulator